MGNRAFISPHVSTSTIEYVYCEQHLFENENMFTNCECEH